MKCIFSPATCAYSISPHKQYKTAHNATQDKTGQGETRPRHDMINQDNTRRTKPRRDKPSQAKPRQQQTQDLEVVELVQHHLPFFPVVSCIERGVILNWNVSSCVALVLSCVVLCRVVSCCLISFCLVCLICLVKAVGEEPVPPVIYKLLQNLQVGAICPF